MRAVEETGLATRTEESDEVAPIAGSSAAVAEIQAAITVAIRFPRNEDKAFERLMRSCRRPAFAEEAEYEFPRGGKKVVGASIYLAREAARVWGNIQHGVRVIADDEEYRTIEAFAWDLETNYKVTAQDTFAKMHQRKNKSTGDTEWVVPDERDLRELTNRRGAIAKRNCILEVVPKDLIDDARAMCNATIQSKAKEDPDAARKRLIVKFGSINVSPVDLEAILGHPVGQSTPEEIAELNRVYKSIADGNSSWSEYAGGHEKRSDGNKGSISVDDLKPGKEPEKAAAAEPEKPKASAASPEVDKKSKSSKPAAGAPKDAAGGNPNYSDHEAPPENLFER